ncbi:MAG: dihydroorotate dehydrogenase [Planctomycetes bacterium]|nr:dihydroorotate dehydrogenase [Planctomycetota bacterium]
MNQKPCLETTLGELTLSNPLLTASGTFGSGVEYAEFIDLRRLGGIVTKSVTAKPTAGNPPPRVTETPSGMLNAIGLQNPGLEVFCSETLPELSSHLDASAWRPGTPRVIVNVAGKATEEYAEVVERLDAEARVDGMEINISCPNVKEGGMAFGICATTCAQLVGELRKRTRKPLLVKLSPNVTDITEIARAAEGSGADVLVVANTLLGMAIDIERRRPILTNITGGLSGPAIHPVALRLVWQVSQAVNLPVVGVGGIASAEEVVAFLMCGASAVEVGTMNFIDPAATMKILEDFTSWLAGHGESARSIVGALQT